MKQVATVKEIQTDKALLLVKRQSMCEGCHKESSCSSCSQVLEIEVDNTLFAEVGDTVEIETPGGSVIGVAALIFLLPLLLAFVAYFVIRLFSDETLYAIIAALAAPTLGYIGIAVGVRKSKKTLAVSMSRIIEKHKS